MSPNGNLPSEIKLFMGETILLKDEFNDYLEIMATVPGYSDLRHYDFFSKLLERPVHSLLMLGVYHGRDICFLMNILKHRQPEREFFITGVDKFTNSPCDDWTPEERTRSWQLNGFGPPPTLEKCIANLKRYNNLNVTLDLHQNFDIAWFNEQMHKLSNGDSSFRNYDVIYLDAAHDETSVVSQLIHCRPHCHEFTILCGDDYDKDRGWGVIDAVDKSFSKREIFHGSIWQSSVRYLKL